MLYKVGLPCKLLLVILGFSPNSFNDNNANERNVNSNGNADNNNVNNTNGARPDSY